jgi:hypothetical protein
MLRRQDGKRVDAGLVVFHRQGGHSLQDGG